MDHIDVPAEQAIAIDSVAEHVRGLRIAFVNVFGVSHPNGTWTLIDAGLPFSESMIRSWALKQFGKEPDCIVLTHGHFDHVGAARGLADHWDVPVYAHELEFPYLTGELEYPAPNVGAGGGLMTLLSPIYPRAPIDLGPRLRALPDGRANQDASSVLPGWDILHTPGHTPGHVSFFRRDDKTLLVGDAFCTTKPESFFEAAVAQQPELHGPPAYFTWDWDLARQSVERIAQLDPQVIAPGHGKPLAGNRVAEELRRLAENFDRVAVPENRR